MQNSYNNVLTLVTSRKKTDETTKNGINSKRLNYIANDIIERFFMFHELISIDSEICLEMGEYILSRKMNSGTRKHITTDIKFKIVDEIEQILMIDMENYNNVKYVINKLRKRINSENNKR